MKGAPKLHSGYNLLPGSDYCREHQFFTLERIKYTPLRRRNFQLVSWVAVKELNKETLIFPIYP